VQQSASSRYFPQPSACQCSLADHARLTVFWAIPIVTGAEIDKESAAERPVAERLDRDMQTARESETLTACRDPDYWSHSTAVRPNSSEVGRRCRWCRKSLTQTRVSIVLLQREIDRLLASVIVDQRKPALATVRERIVVDLPIKHERAPPSEPDPHHAAR